MYIPVLLTMVAQELIFTMTHLNICSSFPDVADL